MVFCNQATVSQIQIYWNKFNEDDKNDGFYTVKKVSHFPVPQPGCHWPNSLWTGKTRLFPPRKSLISDIPAGDGKTANSFLQCMTFIFIHMVSPLSRAGSWGSPGSSSSRRGDPLSPKYAKPRLKLKKREFVNLYLCINNLFRKKIVVRYQAFVCA
jgi:hypothetical protein